MITSAPAKVQAHSPWDPKCAAVYEYPIIKGIFDAAGACMQVSAAATKIAMDTITIEIPKSQVAILAKNGATFVVQGGNSYSMNAMKFSNFKSQ